MIKIGWLRTFFIVIGLIIVLIGCGKGKHDASASWRHGEPLGKERLMIGVIHITDPQTETSGGYTYAHELGILEMQEALALRDDQILRKTNVLDSDPAGIENAMRECIAAGADIIIATSWGYMDICEKLAGEFPHVVFAHASGYKSNDTNFTNYFGRLYQVKYLSGIAAGMKTRTGKIGYVAAMGKDNSEEGSGLNAFALGVERVNPRAKIYLRVTYSWFDPMEEVNATRALVAEGCDVISQGCDSPYPQIEAQKAGIWGVGYNTDMGREAPDAVLTSAIWQWGAYYIYLVRSVIDGSFTTTPYLGGIAEGILDMTPLATELVAPGTAEAMETAREQMLTGKFNVFDGVMETNDGKTIGVEGTTLSDREIQSGINWYYRTIIEP